MQICKKIKPISNLVKYFSTKMAKSKFEYVKNFESDPALLPNCWIVVRIDGRNFHKFADSHSFTKPNDKRALDLMNEAAATVMLEFKDIILAYGQSDEYSFVFRKSADIYKRRSFKITSYVTSLFTSAFVFSWSKFFALPLAYPPAFDSRAVLYPSDSNLRDYLSWRQADVHVNNLYNTCFWSLVQEKKMTPKEAEERLRGTVSSDKNELLFSEFGINYNKEPIMFRKGTILLRKKVLIPNTDKRKVAVVPLHEDLIQDKFWTKHSELLDEKVELTNFENELAELPSLVLNQIKM